MSRLKSCLYRIGWLVE